MSEAQKILIVDDRESNLAGLEQILAETDAVCVRATSGNEALTTTLDHTFAMAILDVQMPEMNGFELAELLRSDPKTRHLPVIFLTAAMLGEHHLFQGYEAGGVDYLTKPFEPAVLLGKVRIFLELDAQRSELIRHREQLEELVQARTRELENKNRALEEEIDRRVRLENDLRRRTEDLQRANDDLGQFVRVASHDMQEPVRAVVHYAQRLEELTREAPDEEARGAVHYVVLGARRIHGLINDYLQFSSIDLHPRRLRTVSCAEVARQAFEDHEQKIAACQATVDVHALPELSVDPRLLIRLFRELLDNALKFSGEDPPRIEVTAKPDGDAWQFRFTDHGIGIDPRFHERIFRVFHRVHGRDRYPGNGIGLAIVRKIVERHGGRIWIESELGEGTTVCFTLGHPAEE